LLVPGGAELRRSAFAAKANQPPATQPVWRHASSLFGDLKYPAGFSHFEYADPAAAKGGSVRQSALGTFDNLIIITEGVKGNLAIGIEQIYDTLLLPSLDEPSSEYCLLAEAVSYPDDFSWVRYRLPPSTMA